MMAQKGRRLLFIHQGALGDQLMALPLLQALKQDYCVDYFGRNPGLECLMYFIDLNFHSLDNQHAIRITSSEYQKDFNKLINIGPFQSISRHLKHTELSTKPQDDSQPIWEQWLSKLGYSQSSSHSIPSSLLSKDILIAPGSGSVTKNWPLDSFLKLSKDIIPNYSIKWLIGPAEFEHGYQEILSKHVNRDHIISCPSTKELNDLLKTKPYYIGCDSGVSHLAGLHQCKGLVIFQASNPRLWHPIGPHLKTKGNEHYSPSYKKVRQNILNDLGV